MARGPSSKEDIVQRMRTQVYDKYKFDIMLVGSTAERIKWLHESIFTALMNYKQRDGKPILKEKEAHEVADELMGRPSRDDKKGVVLPEGSRKLPKILSPKEAAEAEADGELVSDVPDTLGT